ncbi:transcription factor MYB124-like [Wolffia australiana]
MEGENGGRKQPKERHMVSWSQKEDDLLREQVEIHGMENWTSIAAAFKDKTGRQCRRRWFTYLNTECKKGGWSPEEDALLCEAQKIFGNRWTEIAKVVSGRTDNAVKNRFNTLCKKRLKQEAMAKENAGVCGAVRTLSPISLSSFKKIKCQMTSIGENNENPRRRAPLADLGQNQNNNLHWDQDGVGKTSEKKTQCAFLRAGDPKLSALLQQAELLSSLALRVHSDTTDLCLDSAWKELKEYLVRSGEREPERSESAQIDFLLEDFNDLMQELGSSPFSRKGDVLHGPVNDEADSRKTADSETSVDPVKVNPPLTFDSPQQMIPIFSPFSLGIPSPNFSTSERKFLLSVLGSSSSPRGHISPSQKSPACKRALLTSLCVDQSKCIG